MTPARPAGAPGSEAGVPASEEDALGIVEAGEAIGIPTATLLLNGVAMTLGQPRGAARETRRLARDTLRILAGRSARVPAKGDRRFADPAWSQNPAFRRICQEYLSLCESVGNLVDGLEGGRRNWQDAERARFVANIVMSAAAPTNFLFSNPAALKRAFDTAGLSVARGASQWWRHVRHNGGMPSQTDRSVFGVGTDLAVTPGAVVHRDELAEIIGGEPGAGPDTWFKSAAKRPGTWWEVWADWVIERSGDEVPAPAQLGSGAHPRLWSAPGLYVRDRAAG